MKSARSFLPACLIGALLLSGCDPKPAITTYPLTQAEAFNRLQHADITGFQHAEQCAGITLDFAANPQGTTAVEWQASSGFSRIVGFTVRLQPVDAANLKTLIEVSPDPQGGEAYDGTKHYDHPALAQPLRPALEELVASAMEQRPYDASRLIGLRPNDPACNANHAFVSSTGSANDQNRRPPGPAATDTPVPDTDNDPGMAAGPQDTGPSDHSRSSYPRD